MVYADVLQPCVKRYALLYNAGLIVGGSLFIALLAQVAIPLPFSLVPITGQTLAVLLTGALLGSRRGAFAGGKAGIIHLLGPTGGYLFGFVAAAFITRLLAEKGWDRRVGTTILAMFLGNCLWTALVNLLRRT